MSGSLRLWSIYCRCLAKAEGARGPTTVGPSTASCRCCAAAGVGRVCRASMAPPQSAGGRLGHGDWTVLGRGFQRSLSALLAVLGKLKRTKAFLHGSFVPAKR
jgi:hypothetical protein